MCVVCCVAKLDTDGLKKAGVSADDMSLHLALLFEYVFAHMNHDQYFHDGQGHMCLTLRTGVCGAVRDVIVCCVCACVGEEVVTLTIMDCKDISLTKAVSFDNLSIVKATTEVIDKFYPNRVHKIFVVNTPRQDHKHTHTIGQHTSHHTSTIAVLGPLCRGVVLMVYMNVYVWCRFFGPVFNVIKGALPGSMGSTIEILYDIKDLQK